MHSHLLGVRHLHFLSSPPLLLEKIGYRYGSLILLETGLVALTELMSSSYTVFFFCNATVFVNFEEHSQKVFCKRLRLQKFLRRKSLAREFLSSLQSPRQEIQKCLIQIRLSTSPFESFDSGENLWLTSRFCQEKS